MNETDTGFGVCIHAVVRNRVSEKALDAVQGMGDGLEYRLVGFGALAAVVTPPYPGSQVILAIPLLVLFEGSLLLMRLQERKDTGSDVTTPDPPGDGRTD